MAGCAGSEKKGKKKTGIKIGRPDMDWTHAFISLTSALHWRMRGRKRIKREVKEKAVVNIADAKNSQ